SKTFAVTFTNIGRQTITVTDTAKATIKGISPASVVSVTGTAPSVTAGLAGPAVGVRGQPMTFTLSAGETGQPAGTVFTYKIDWDGNGTVDQTITGAS
ncbi:hypothetical protein, partial [Zavarzinella formosa]|uniref:hypothetical protein n=1 Tax=Zavarzinella formosa TaxID=360055 RepID=UPI000593FEB2